MLATHLAPPLFHRKFWFCKRLWFEHFLGIKGTDLKKKIFCSCLSFQLIFVSMFFVFFCEQLFCFNEINAFLSKINKSKILTFVKHFTLLICVRFYFLHLELINLSVDQLFAAAGFNHILIVFESSMRVIAVLREDFRANFRKNWTRVQFESQDDDRAQTFSVLKHPFYLFSLKDMKRCSELLFYRTNIQLFVR